MSQVSCKTVDQLGPPPVRTIATGTGQNILLGVPAKAPAGKFVEAVPLNLGQVLDANRRLRDKADEKLAAKMPPMQRSLDRGPNRYAALRQTAIGNKPSLARAFNLGARPTTRADLKNMHAKPQPAAAIQQAIPTSVSVPLTEMAVRHEAKHDNQPSSQPAPRRKFSRETMNNARTRLSQCAGFIPNLAFG
jgi:hypothetical protein